MPRESSPAQQPLGGRKTLAFSNFFHRLLFLFLFPLLGLALFECFSRGGPSPFFLWVITRPVLFLQNLALFMGLFWLLDFFRSDRARLATALALLLLFCLLGIVNAYKIRYRFEPVLLTDLTLLGEMQTAVQQIDLKINWWQIALVLGFGIAAVVLALVFAQGVRRKRNVLVPLAGVILCCSVIPTCSLGELAQGNYTDLSDCAWQRGTLYTLVAMERQRMGLSDIPYQEAAVDPVWQEAVASAQADAPQTPNIIFVLAESFTDQRHLSPYLQFTEPLMPFYDQLRQACATGEIYVPKQGGGTSETEFEVLTGLESRYSANPYSLGIPHLYSVASILRERGYHASALHWFTGVFYNRYKNLRLLGFDELHTTDTTRRPFTKIGQYISDQDHYTAALAQMRQTPGKDFIFCITMQNHGTYGYDDFGVTYGAGTPFSNRLQPDTEKTMRNYCYLLQQSDKALQKFCTELQAFDEPTLVVFFGDHIPPFSKEMYQELGMPIEGAAGHLTPYFIWNNRQNTPTQTTMNAWQLGPYALSLAGIRSDPFFSLVESRRESGKNQDDAYKLLSFDALFGKQRAYALAGYRLESEDWQIGGKMDLQGFACYPMDGGIYVMPRMKDPLQNYKLLVNGQPLDDWYVLDNPGPFTLQCAMLSPSQKQLNQSQVVPFSSSADLLAQSQPLPFQAVDLSEISFRMENDAGRCYVFSSAQPFSAPVSCLTLDGKRQQWQPPYGIRKAGQYFLASADAPLLLSLDKENFPEGTPSPEALSAYLKSHQATLLLFQ